MAKLVILTGRHRGKKLNLPSRNKTLIVGRGEKCAMRLASTDVSREHCTIRIEDGSIFVKDLGSGNGTQINEVSIEGEVELKPGQFLQVGPMLMQLEGEKPRAVESESPDGPIESDSVSGDNIASVLAEEAAGEHESTETTILKAADVEKPKAPAVPIPPAAKRQFDSIAEESADIIRRHIEWKAAVEAQS
jgi:pSer/pThr/pTyr-binding forkhead associated (FHA) protein